MEKKAGDGVKGGDNSQRKEERQKPIQDKKAAPKLEQENYYHGILTRREAIKMLQNNGDFLVRARETPYKATKVDVILSVMVNGQPRHFPMVFKQSGGIKQVRLQGSNHKVDGGAPGLVDFYKRHTLVRGTRLGRHIPRPAYYIKSVDIRRKKFLGEGNYATVYYGQRKIVEDHYIDVAIKIPKAENNMDADLLAKCKDELIKEAKLMAGYSHPNVVRFFGVAADVPPMMLIMEYCSGGSLLDHLQKDAENITFEERVLYLWEAATGMAYLCEEKGCVHRDLAARNCLLNEQGRLKIADFGLANFDDKKKKKAVDDKDDSQNQQCPIQWMSPETLRVPQVFSEKSDVYSFGVLIYEVYSDGKEPWLHLKENLRRVAHLVRHGRHVPVPPDTHEDIKPLMFNCLKQAPEDRPKFSQLVVDLDHVYKRMTKDTKSTRRDLHTDDEEALTTELYGLEQDETAGGRTAQTEHQEQPTASHTTDEDAHTSDVTTPSNTVTLPPQPTQMRSRTTRTTVSVDDAICKPAQQPSKTMKTIARDDPTSKPTLQSSKKTKTIAIDDPSSKPTQQPTEKTKTIARDDPNSKPTLEPSNQNKTIAIYEPNNKPTQQPIPKTKTIAIDDPSIKPTQQPIPKTKTIAIDDPSIKKPQSTSKKTKTTIPTDHTSKPPQQTRNKAKTTISNTDDTNSKSPSRSRKGHSARKQQPPKN